MRQIRTVTEERSVAIVTSIETKEAATLKTVDAIKVCIGIEMAASQRVKK